MIYIATFAIGCVLGIRAYIKHRGEARSLFFREDMTSKEREEYLDWCAQTLIEHEQQAETFGDL